VLDNSVINNTEREMFAKVVSCSIGAVLGNFLYQFFGSEMYSVAAERSFFQVLALTTFYAYCRLSEANAEKLEK